MTAVCERLDGEWLLLGGALVALWLEPRRVTEDVDLIGLRGTADERYALMELATELGLPVEAVNSAADFFVRRIPDWRAELVELRRGAGATVYRPSVTLFLLLKLGPSRTWPTAFRPSSTRRATARCSTGGASARRSPCFPLRPTAGKPHGARAWAARSDARRARSSTTRPRGDGSSAPHGGPVASKERWTEVAAVT